MADLLVVGYLGYQIYQLYGLPDVSGGIGGLSFTSAMPVMPAVVAPDAVAPAPDMAAAAPEVAQPTVVAATEMQQPHEAFAPHTEVVPQTAPAYPTDGTLDAAPQQDEVPPV